MSGGKVRLVVESPHGDRITMDELTTILGFAVEVSPGARVSFTLYEISVEIPATRFIEALGRYRLQVKDAPPAQGEPGVPGPQGATAPTTGERAPTRRRPSRKASS